MIIKIVNVICNIANDMRSNGAIIDDNCADMVHMSLIFAHNAAIIALIGAIDAAFVADMSAVRCC